MTLLGDPELPVWNGPIVSMTATHPAMLTAGAPNTFSVHAVAGSSPLVGATVCLWKPGDVYLITPTDATGTATFEVEPATPGTLMVTVSKQHFVPNTAAADVVAPAGDMNCDGTVDLGDINPFVALLGNP